MCPSVPLSQHLRPLLSRLASAHPSTKFLSIPADLCIPNYPDKNVPTLLVYRNGDMVGNIVAGMGLKGMKTTVRGEWNIDRLVASLQRHACLRLHSSFGRLVPLQLLGITDSFAELEALLIRNQAMEKPSPALRASEGDDSDLDDDRERVAGTVNAKPGGLRGSTRRKDDDSDSDLDM